MNFGDRRLAYVRPAGATARVPSASAAIAGAAHRIGPTARLADSYMTGSQAPVKKDRDVTGARSRSILHPGRLPTLAKHAFR